MLGGVIQNVQEHLAQAFGIAGDLRNILTIVDVLKLDALLRQAAAVHIHGIFKFAADIGRFYVQRHASVLHPGKIQQLHDHFRQTLGLAGNDLQTLTGIGIHPLIQKQRLAPAVDDGQRCPQLMGELGDKFRLHFLVLADFGGHFIDGIRQFADLILIFGLDLDAVAAAGNTLCFLGDLSNRNHDGFQIRCVTEDHHQQNRNQRRKTGNTHHDDLPVHQLRGGNVAQHADDLAVVVDHRAGNRHDPLTGGRVLAHIGWRRTSGGNRLINIRSIGRSAAPLTVGGSNNVTVPVDKLQFDCIFVLKILSIADAGLIIGVVIQIDILLEKNGSILCPVSHIRLHIGVIIGCKAGGNNKHTDHAQSKDHTNRVDQPALTKSADLIKQFQSYAPHL